MLQKEVTDKKVKIEYYLDCVNKDTSLEVSKQLKEGSQFNVGWFKLLFYPPLYFVQEYFLKKGYKSGVYGFVKSVLSSIERLLLLSKMWEYNFRKQEESGKIPPLTEAEMGKIKNKYLP